MLSNYRKRIKTRKEKKIIDFLLISSIASTITNILTAIVITIIINRSLFLDHFIILNVVIVEYALVFYYWLLNYDTRNIIKEILSKISNFVVILDTNLRIIDMSLNFKTMASNNLNSSSDISFEKFIIEEKLFLANIKKALYEKIDTFDMNISYKTFEGRQIETNTTITKIYDRFGDFFSFLIVSNLNNYLSYFKSTYKLTDRQMEIIQFAINGKTNEEIANFLNLKKRTIESHLFNIYYKLNINNKIELIKFFNGFCAKS